VSIKGKSLKGDLLIWHQKELYGGCVAPTSEKGHEGGYGDPYLSLGYQFLAQKELDLVSEAEAEDQREFDLPIDEQWKAALASLLPDEDQPMLVLQIIYGGHRGCYVKVDPASDGKIRIRLISQHQGSEVLEDRVIDKTKLLEFLDNYQAY